MYYNKNGFDNCYEELLTFYPIFYREIFEMNELLKTYGGLLDVIQKNIDTMLANNYIQTADETTITKFEKFLYVNTDKTKSLEERRRFVLSFFIGFGRISATKIKAVIKNYTNAEADVQFKRADKNGNNRLFVTCDRGTEDVLRMYDIADILTRKIPAHIFLSVLIKYVFECSKSNKNYVGTAVRVKMRNIVIENGL